MPPQNLEATLWVPRTLALPPAPEAADGSVDITASIEKAIEISNKVIPYDIYKANEYRAARAEAVGGANCYAGAEAKAGILAAWGIRSFIAINSLHASNMVVEDRPLYFDNTGIQSYELPFNLPTLTDPTGFIRAAHMSFVERLGESGEGAEFFWISGQKLHNKSAGDTMRDGPRPSKIVRGAHILATAPLGIRMLSAIGDLKRYKQTRKPMDPTRMQALLKLTPSFFLDRDILSQEATDIR